MTFGDASVWSDTFPDHLVPRIIDLVWDTWEAFPKPGPGDPEVPITRLFKRSLKQAKDYRRLPVRIEREAAENDPLTGRERGRIDLKFAPAQSAREEVYFAFECKRLNVIENGHRRTLAPEYVADGMLRVVTGQYSASALQGGMIGYVMDGRCADAIRLVTSNISNRSAELKLAPGGGLMASSLKPGRAIRETRHALGDSREFRLHHLFLARMAIDSAPVRTAEAAITTPMQDMHSTKAKK